MLQEDGKILVDCLVVLGLLGASYTDMKKKKIWIPLFLVEIPIILGMNYVVGNRDYYYFLACVVEFCAFYGISIITRGQLGKGDAFLFALVGSGMGLLHSVCVIYLSFLLTALFSGIWLVQKKVNRKDTIPMAPFILFSYITVMVVKRI